MIRNKYVFLLAVLFSGLTAIGQNSKESFFAFKEDWSPINNIDLATYFMHRVKENDTTYICRFYRTMGPMVKCETYKDEELTIPHGRFVWYNADGNIDSAGMVSNGKKDGYWEINQQNGHAAMNILFEKGKRVWTKNFLARKTYYADGRVEDHDTSKKDSVEEKEYIVDQSPAEFKGGIPGWIRYLENNLRTPDRFKNIVGDGGSGSVTLFFLIDKEGKLYDPYIAHSVEWSVDMESLRVLKESPKWKPAYQNGKPVLYRHKQTITHAVRRL